MKMWPPLASTVFALIVWQLIVSLTGVKTYLLPGPGLVAESWWHHRVLIAENALITLKEIALGMIIGTVLGIVTAISLATSKVVRTLVQPILVFTQSLPVFALAPILTLWLGFGLWSKVAMAVLIIYFPVTSAFFDGLMRTPPGYLDLAKTMQASAMRILWQIRIPAALPNLGAGVRLAAVYATIGAVIGEWVGASKGLGALMIMSNGRGKTDLMFAALLTLGVMSVVFYLLVAKLTRRLGDRET